MSDLPSADDRVEFSYHDRTYCMSEWFAVYMETEVEKMLNRADEDGDVPSGATFCGCPTCVIREVMVTTAALVIEGLEKKEIRVHKEVPA